MKTLILVRHGESAYSARGLCNGDPSIRVPLTPRGREEAAALGQALAGTEIDLCATSEFGRTQETADIALAGRAIPRIVLPSLNDLNYGDLEGCTRDEYHAWQREHGRLARLPGGESRIEVARRSADALDELLAREECTVLAVSHEIVIELVLNVIDGSDPATHQEIVYATPYEVTEEQAAGAARALRAWRPDSA